ncbi:hypothetical protein NKH57_04940 [Mesorhizobium sp. M1050]|uniref:hypothetical protein n=1 Tax=unclassified Mesorhizobium TaxID=325217 RepID=UPI00333ACD49
MVSEPFGRRPIELNALTPKQREIIYAGAVRRAHQERSESIWLGVVRVAAMFRKRP